MADTETAAVSVVNGGPALGGFSRGQLLELLTQMLLYRRFEEKAEEAYAIGKIGGFCHLHIGQEGAAAGCILPLRQDDYVISSYRSHTQALAKGLSPRRSCPSFTERPVEPRVDRVARCTCSVRMWASWGGTVS